ncbi:MAG: DUF1501 domain-containing protein, partial [Planctomycetaceae bacterium]
MHPPAPHRAGFPCGQSRREAIWEMGAGVAGLALSALLDADGFFARHAAAATPADPLAPRPGHRAVPARSVIFLLMNGAPSHVDTFDPKPLLEKHAGQSLPAEMTFINSGGRALGKLTPACRPFKPCGQSGIPVSDFFPKLREHADKFAVIRSCHTDTHAHGSALV